MKQINLMCFFLFTLELCLFIQLLNFACSWFELLFANHMTMFTTLNGRMQCSMVGFLFREGANVVTYVTPQKL
jgi:hypothetical protein